MSSGTLNRRQFVVLGGATVFTIVVGVPAFGSTSVSNSFISVGYHPGRSRLRMGGRGAAAPMSFIDARSVLSGDPLFFRAGAQFRLHGFHRAVSGPGAERIDVEMLYSVPELDEPAKFYAFSSIDAPGRKMTSNSVAFNVPVESTGKIELAIERRSLDTDAVERAIIAFDVNDGMGAAIKLNEGLYAIALVRDGQSGPDWTSVRTSSIVSSGSREPVELVSSQFGGAGAVPFDYLLLSVSRVRGADEPVEAEVSPDEVHASTVEAARGE